MSEEDDEEVFAETAPALAGPVLVGRVKWFDPTNSRSLVDPADRDNITNFHSGRLGG